MESILPMSHGPKLNRENVQKRMQVKQWNLTGNGRTIRFDSIRVNTSPLLTECPIPSETLVYWRGICTEHTRGHISITRFVWPTIRACMCSVGHADANSTHCTYALHPTKRYTCKAILPCSLGHSVRPTQPRLDPTIIGTFTVHLLYNCMHVFV